VYRAAGIQSFQPSPAKTSLNTRWRSFSGGSEGWTRCKEWMLRIELAMSFMISTRRMAVDARYRPFCSTGLTRVW
jgi:hypothetical protein